MRDRALGSTIRMQFVSTNPDGGGAPVAPSSAFAASDIRIYKDGSASEKTTTNGITVTSPFDSITGLHLVEIDTSNSTGDVGFWASGSVYHVRLVTAKTVATYSVSGLLIGEFSLELQTADVRKFGGTAGTFTSGKPDVQAAASVSGAVGSVTGAVGSVTGNVGGNVNGNVVGSVASVTGNVGGNVSGNVSGSVGSVTGAVGSVTGSVGSVVGNVGGSVASVAGAVGSVTGNVGGDVSGKVLGGGVGTISGDGVRAASVTGAVGSVTGSVGSVVGAVALDPASITAVQTGLATSSALTAVGNNVTAILEDTGTTIPTQISGLNNLSSAQVVSALGTGTWATAIPWNAAWDAEVQSEVQDAIEVNNLDHLLKIPVDTSFATTVHLNSVIGHMADNGTTATFSRSTDSLEAIRDHQSTGGGASLEDIIAGVQSVSGAIVEAQNSATLSIRIGDTWTQDIESLGDLTDKTVSFALKRRASDADTAAIVFITEGTGLTRLNGAATTAGWGSITILDEVAGDIRLRLESDATSLLTSGSYVDAIKVLEDGDDRTLRNAGRTVVSAGVIADIT